MWGIVDLELVSESTKTTPRLRFNRGIPVTKLEKELKYPPLIVRFSDPAARLEDLKKLSLQGVRLEPQIGGAWSWNSDKELVFRPTEDWPADQKYRIVF